MVLGVRFKSVMCVRQNRMRKYGNDRVPSKRMASHHRGMPDRPGAVRHWVLCEGDAMRYDLVKCQGKVQCFCCWEYSSRVDRRGKISVCDDCCDWGLYLMGRRVAAREAEEIANVGN